jgi:hypothetical protein
MLDMTNVTHLRPRVAADTLAARLLLLRHELHWSQREATAQTGVPYRTWQGMETGRETRSLDRHVVAIAAVSGYDRDWLMWGGALWAPEDPHPGGSEVTRGYDAYPLELARAA